MAALNFPNAPTVGQLYPSPPTAGVAQYRWDGEKWVSVASGTTAVFVLQEFTATQGQTLFTPTTGYTPGRIIVARNGVIADNADFTATNGTSVTLATACEAGEIIKVMSF